MLCTLHAAFHSCSLVTWLSSIMKCRYMRHPYEYSSACIWPHCIHEVEACRQRWTGEGVCAHRGYHIRSLHTPPQAPLSSPKSPSAPLIPLTSTYLCASFLHAIGQGGRSGEESCPLCTAALGQVWPCMCSQWDIPSPAVSTTGLGGCFL